MASMTEEQLYENRYDPVYNIFNIQKRPVMVKQYANLSSVSVPSKVWTYDLIEYFFRRNSYDRHVFAERPLFGPLLFENESSDARDHCANERTFLSWLRLSVYMTVVSVAVIISFHLKNQPTPLELRLALPFGIVFWLLALACLVAGVANYVKTVARYSRRQALVQSGWKTQVVFTVVAIAIVAACLLFLTTNAGGRNG